MSLCSILIDKIAEKRYGGVFFWPYTITFYTLIQQKLTPPELLFSAFDVRDDSSYLIINSK